MLSWYTAAQGDSHIIYLFLPLVNTFLQDFFEINHIFAFCQIRIKTLPPFCAFCHFVFIKKAEKKFTCSASSFLLYIRLYTFDFYRRHKHLNVLCARRTSAFGHTRCTTVTNSSTKHLLISISRLSGSNKSCDRAIPRSNS